MIAAAILTLLTLGGMMVAFVRTAVVAPGLSLLAVGLADLFGPRRS